MTISSATALQRRALHRGKISRYAILWVTLALFVGLAVSTPGFFTSANLTNVLHQQATILIVAAPFTLTLIAGAFDVSLSAIYVLSPLVALQVQIATGSTLLAVVTSISAGTICGLLNSIVVVRLKINSFIATLATSFIYFGIAYVVSEQSILSPTEASFRDLSMLRIGPFTSATVFAALVLVFFWVLLSKTRYGRYVYATGANAEAARLSGVRAELVLASTFVIVGAAAGFAGILNASQSMSARATDDFTFVFAVLAAVVVGGTSISGGSGAVWRTLVGAIFIAILGNGFNLNQVDPILQRVVLGLVILLAVGIDVISKKPAR